MLRKAVLRASATASPKSEDVRLWLGVHDLSRIECTLAVQLPARDERRYDVAFSVDVPATLFPSHNVWEHLQIFTRLRSPAEEGPLHVESGDLEVLRRDTLGVAHRLKQLRMRFERSCVAAASTTREQPDPALHETLTELIIAGFELLSEMRRQLDVVVPRAPEQRRERALVDEFLSHQLIDFYSGCERALGEVLLAEGSRVRPSQAPWLEELRCLIAEGLSEELAHRRGRGYGNPRADAPTELAQFIERGSQLKKHFQDVLYLDVQSWFVDSRAHNLVGVVAAALAATVWLSFTLLPIGPGARAGFGLGSFALLFALAYAVKDRVKELTRGWITGRLTRLYGQRRVTMRVPARIDGTRPVLLDTRESFDIEAQLNPSQQGDERPDSTVGRPRRVARLHFRMRATLNPSAELQRAHIDSIKHILRYDLSPIVARLDNATKQVPVLDSSRRMRFADAPKQYRFPVHIAYGPAEGERVEVTANLVLSNRGIERIEPRE